MVLLFKDKNQVEKSKTVSFEILAPEEAELCCGGF